jgi:hypothetical protein
MCSWLEPTAGKNIVEEKYLASAGSQNTVISKAGRAEYNLRYRNKNNAL